MHNRQCPRCNRTGSLLVEESVMSDVDYYGCDECSVIWSLDERDPSKRLSLPTQPPAEHPPEHHGKR